MLASNSFKVLIIAVVVSAIAVFSMSASNPPIVQNDTPPPAAKAAEKAETPDQNNSQNNINNSLDSPQTVDPQESDGYSEDTADAVLAPTEPHTGIPAVKESAETIPTPVAETETQNAESETSVLTFSEINTLARPALVNILCQSQSGGLQKTTTGSGVIVDPRGIILTNAHIAQEFLLVGDDAERTQNCSIRTGSPARAMYRAEILYLPYKWVIENGAVQQFETLEESRDDFAFLLITESTNTTRALPSSFAFVSFDPDEKLAESGSVFIGGYPAGFLGSAAIQKDLYITSSVAMIDKYITFNGKTIDAITFDGTVLAQQGASGGAVIDSTNMLIAIISSLITAENTSDRTLNALTVWHIDERMKELEEYGISTLFEGNVYDKAERFNNTMTPILKKILTNSLQ